MVSTLVSIPGYHIYDLLYNGSRTLVYRGYRETDSLPVVIKLLKNPYPSLGKLLSFRNQYTIAKNLNSPLIVQTYSLEPYQNGYALVMEDFGGISLKNYFTSEQRPYIASSEEFLEIAIALCNILDTLYRERIIHKDIKPANILINPETKQVKLIDFSIASLLPRETQEIQNANALERKGRNHMSVQRVRQNTLHTLKNVRIRTSSWVGACVQTLDVKIRFVFSLFDLRLERT
ncbi:MAG: protein kinase [Nostoc sp.]